MVPVKITFDIDGYVVVPEYPIHLDALLAYARVSRAMNSGDTDDVYALQDDLPLSREQRDNDWVWKASALALEGPALRDHRFQTRNTDINAIAAARETVLRYRGDKVNLGSGPYRLFAFMIAVRYVRCATAWAVGDPDRIRNLLNRIHWIGKSGRLGYGLIRSISVEPDDAARTRWCRRVLPWRPDENEYLPLVAAHRPPYWDARGRKKCWAHAAIC